MVFVKAFDEIFSNTVVARWSYITKEFVWGARFNPMFYAGTDRQSTFLDISLLNSYSPATIPAASNTL